MNSMTLSTSPRSWSRYYSTNSTTLTNPSIMECSIGSVGTPTTGSNLAKLMVYGSGAEATEAIYHYLYTYSPLAGTSLFIPSFVCKLKWTWTTSTNRTGLADQLINTTDEFADQVELVDGDTSIRLVTDTSGGMASVTLDLEGGSHLAMIFDDGDATEPTNWNCIIGLF